MSKKNEAPICLRVVRRKWLLKRDPAANAYSNNEYFAFAQKPLFLWFLSFIALGSLSYVFGNYSSCRNAQAVDEQKVQNYIAELRGRESVINDAISAERISRARYRVLKNLIDSENNYLYIENKGKLEIEMKENIISILKRWHQWLRPSESDGQLTEKVHEDPMTYFVVHHSNGDRSLSSVTSPIELQAYFDAFFTDFDGLKWLLTTTKIEDYPLTVVPDPAFIVEENSKEFEKRLFSYHTSVGGFEALSWNNILLSNYCTKRAFWPF